MYGTCDDPREKVDSGKGRNKIDDGINCGGRIAVTRADVKTSHE